MKWQMGVGSGVKVGVNWPCVGSVETGGLVLADFGDLGEEEVGEWWG